MQAGSYNMSDDNNVVAFRRYVFPRRKLVDSDFIPSSYEQNKEFMEEDLAASGLTPEDLQASVEGKYALPSGFINAYTIPYTDPDGNLLKQQDGNELIMYRLKLKPAPGVNTRQKYSQPNRDELAEHGLSGVVPYIPPMYHEREKSEILLICEGEKKTCAAIKHLNISSIGIGGCWAWRDGGIDGDCHPWILDLAQRHKKILIVPDGDFRRYDIAKAYGTLCSELRRKLGEDYDINIVESPGKLDDLIVQWGPEAEDNFWSLPVSGAEGLVEDPGILIKKYDLSFRVDAKGRGHVYENTSNITKLIERHPAFPTIWLDTDTNRIMMGDEPVNWGHTDMDIANHFQYNFQMPTVKKHDVGDVLKALAIQNSKSPFFEWIKNLAWDGQKRIETWMIRYWSMEDTPYIREVSTKFLVAAVHRLMDPGCKVDWMLITSGTQGTGKSTMPEIMFRGNTINILGSHTDKDVQMMMHSGICVILDELDALNAKEADFWKSAITTREDRFRPPFGKEVMYFKRRSIIYGTTNSTAFLANDNSGYRRYKPVIANTLLDFKGLEDEVPQLWAEAYHLVRSGMSPEVLVDPPEEQFQSFVTTDAIQEALYEWLRSVVRSAAANNSFHVSLHTGPAVEFILNEALTGAEVANITQKKVRGKATDYLLKMGCEAIANVRIKEGKGRRGFRLSGEALEKLRG